MGLELLRDMGWSWGQEMEMELLRDMGWGWSCWGSGHEAENKGTRGDGTEPGTQD